MSVNDGSLHEAEEVAVEEWHAVDVAAVEVMVDLDRLLAAVETAADDDGFFFAFETET